VSEQVPSILAILVVKDGAPWVRRSLASLSRQTHGRLGVLAVDNGSTDDSTEILRSILGARRCIRIPRNIGFAAAVARALEVPAAAEADYVLLLHDDIALAPDAVQRMVETARRVRGAGVVAPKVLDWTRPGVLLEIGYAADRFGYPYSPLEEGEIDQGQYDAAREVLFVSSAAMLISREALARIAPPDERLRSGQSELDFCWRVRLAGLRVLVDPRAEAIHRVAGERGDRAGRDHEGERYLAERAGLLSLLKNYRLITLLWVLPLYAVQAVGRFFFYLLSRHVDRSVEVARAWGWNLLHLPGTVRRRFRAQRARRVRDREIARFMSPAGTRLQRWALQASSLLVARRAGYVEDEEELEAPPLPRRVASFAAAHPVSIGWLVAALATLVAFRDVLFVPRIEGGSLPVLPGGPLDFFREFGASWRTTGLGGAGGASPALVLLGLGSLAALGDPMLLMRLLVALTPILAAVSCYRAVVKVTGHRGSAVVAAGSYALSALGLWTVSEGSLPAVVLLVVIPWLGVRLAEGFGRVGPRGPLRWVVASGAVLAVAASFFPAVWISVLSLVVPLVLIPERRGSRVRGLALTAVSVAAAVVLVFPLAVALAGSEGGALVGSPGRSGFGSLLRLSPGSSPGSGVVALFLPVAGILGFAFALERARWAARALLTAAVAIPLAWLAAAGHLPPLLANPLAFLTPAAFSLSLLVGLGVRSLVPEVRRTAFGIRQVAVAALALVLAVGLTFQMLSAMGAGWAVGDRRLPPAWPVIATAEQGEPFRVLWLGSPDGTRFQPPGGETQGTVEAGAASVRYGVTGRAGRSILAVGVPWSGSPYDRLEVALEAILSGRIRHGGSLLAPFGIRYVVAAANDLPEMAAERLALQLDVDLVQTAGGMRIWRNARALPVAAVLPGPLPVQAARSDRLLATTSLDTTEALPMSDAPGAAWDGSVPSSPSLVFVATEFDDRWRLDGQDTFPAFGWAVGAEANDGASMSVRFQGGSLRTLEVAGMALLWALALWILLRRSDRSDVRARREQVAAADPLLPGSVATPERRPARGGAP
jgi:GT2 family glycosyltransferase